MEDNSAVRVELALRGAQIAKTALELLSLSPEIARLQLVEIVKQVREVDEFLKLKGFLR